VTVCPLAVLPGNRNRRRNTGIVISVGGAGFCGSDMHVAVDAGKTWWLAALEFFPIYQIADLDAVVLTHAHADACFGLDGMPSRAEPSRAEPSRAEPSRAERIE
jgi:phosphoribosyl 1,2-cyclic phosphodiesterase